MAASAARICSANIDSAAFGARGSHLIRKNASRDRKSTRLNSSHDQISYAVFCLKKKTQDKGDPRQINLDQEHLESHHHLLFRGLQVKEDGVPRLGKGGAACGALEDASRPTLRQIGRDCTDVPAVYHLSICAIRIRARLAPGLGRSHGQSSGS